MTSLERLLEYSELHGQIMLTWRILQHLFKHARLGDSE